MDLSRISLRPPRPEDAPRIREIDAAGLATGHATFRDMAHDWQSFSAAYLGRGGLALVAEEGGRVLGWAGVGPTSQRAVYAGVGEVSVYLDPASQGAGLGRHLLGGLVKASEAAGYWTLVAQIFPENGGSLALHAGQGFRTLGRRERLGRMGYGPLAGQWRDVLMLERRSTTVG
jgi:phosphinothricin acetyltransferase